MHEMTSEIEEMRLEGGRGTVPAPVAGTPVPVPVLVLFCVLIQNSLIFQHSREASGERTGPARAEAGARVASQSTIVGSFTVIHG
jgi:hypothetical protein